MVLHDTEVFKALKSKRDDWNEVVLFQESCLFTFDAIQALKSYISQNSLNKIPLKGTAFVFEQAMEGSNLIKSILRPLYGKQLTNRLIP